MRKETRQFKKIQEKFFEELSDVGRSFDSFSGASFITSAINMFEDICTIIIKMERLNFSETGEVLSYLYSVKKLKRNYSELYSRLNEWEDHIQYGELTLAEEEIDIEDVSYQMESMIDELIELATNE